MLVPVFCFILILTSCGNDDGDEEYEKEPPQENVHIVKLSCPDSNHPHAIDLGLPSGLKWACCNVGAKSRSDVGYYVAWGELSEKSSYTWDNYKWQAHSAYHNGLNLKCDNITKYCQNLVFGYMDYVDDLDELLPEDDIATQKWGKKWRMPTVGEIDDLVMRCAWKKATMSGVKGRWIVGPNGNSIFLPVANHISESGVEGIDFWGLCEYWSSSLYQGGIFACTMGFDDNVKKESNGSLRSDGLPVRPVYDGK